MIKLIATDMDGTFLDSKKKFDNEFIDIFFELKKRDIKFVIASGNQFYRLYQKFLPISDDMYFIAENGSIISEGAKIIYSNTLLESDVKDTRKVLEDYPNIFVIVCGKKGAYLLEEDRKYLDVVKLHYCNYELVNSFDDIDDEVLKIALYDGNGKISDYYQDIASRLPERLKVVTSGNTWMDIQNKSINKGIAMNILQDRYNISKDECMAFGDQMNDYQMLQEVKYSCAMANAVDEIKSICNEVVASNDEQGVLKRIKEELGL